MGLFQDLQNINPFDETFRKATDLIKTGTLFLPETTVDDTLHTPNVFPHIEETTKPNKFSRNVSNENEFTVTTINNDILKLSDKESPEQNRNKDFESDNDDIEVLSLRSSSSSEQSDENDFIETNSDTLLSNKLDDGVNSNLTATVNNLSDVEIRTNRTLITIVQKDNCKKVESKEDLKSKLKDALHARVRSEHSKSDNENVNFCVLYNIPHSKQMQKKLLQHSKKIIATNEVRTRKLISTQEVTHVEEQIDDNISKKRMTDRDRQREINRVAQVRSRERKKVWIGQMEKEVKLLQDEKKELWLENQTLKQEVMWLKSMLLFHKDCPVSKDPEVSKYFLFI